MQVTVFDPSCDASRISGFTVVVDVFRAFSVAYYIHARKPARYLVVDDVGKAFALRDSLPGAVLVGERGGIKVEGFDYGNSPTEIAEALLEGATVIHTTTAGTKGLMRQPEGNEVVVGSFVNARALVRHVRERGIERVNVYCTAPKGELFGEEDYLFAEYFANELEGKPNYYRAIVERLREGSGKGFSEMGFAPRSDFVHCTDLDRFDAVLVRRAPEGGKRHLELVPAGGSR